MINTYIKLMKILAAIMDKQTVEWICQTIHKSELRKVVEKL